MLLTLISYLLASDVSDATQSVDMSGTWNVSTKVTFSTCGSVKVGDISSYIWISNVDTFGKISISVQGQTSFPTLTGEISSNGDRLDITLVGISKYSLVSTSQVAMINNGSGYHAASSNIKLTAIQGNISGQAYISNIVVNQSGDTVGLYPCVVVRDIVLKR